MDEDIVADGALAQSEAQRAVFWRLREDQPEGQRRLGLQLKHDISVPPSSIGEFLKAADKQCYELLGGVRINAFGHLGDGNVHYNISPPKGQKDFSGQENEIATKITRLASNMGGSFAAEHGLGRSKVTLADTLRHPIERQLMARFKSALDKKNLFNPGVIVTRGGSL